MQSSAECTLPEAAADIRRLARSTCKRLRLPRRAQSRTLLQHAALGREYPAECCGGHGPLDARCRPRA
eukprot:4342927-Alexandrium_andersonii.AAC.1